METSALKRRIATERRIVRAIANRAIVLGFTVSVCDGEEWTLIKSANVRAIMNAVMTTDSDILSIRNQTGNRVGKVYLVYGNDGFDVIADHTASDDMESFLAPVHALAGALETES